MPSILTELTDAEGIVFNELRSLFGPQGPLIFLKFEGRNADPQFSSLKVYAEDEQVNGWRAEPVRGDDGGNFVALEIADVDGELDAIADPPSGEATHFWLAGEVKKIEPDQTQKPLIVPRVWKLRGTVTNETFTP
jgi:hypothetical protein